MAENDDSPKLNTNISSFRQNRKSGILNQIVHKNIRYTGDGEDCVDKAIGYSITGGVFGTLYGAMYVALAYEKPQPYPPLYRPGIINLGKLATCTVTFAATGSMFAVTSCYTSYVRGKDDSVNQFIGGFGAGLVIGAKFRSVAAMILSGTLIGVTSASLRYLDLHRGIETFVPDTISRSSIPDNRYGWQSPLPKDSQSITISSASKKQVPEWYESKKSL
ncbi:uncharacterized protein TRIADDRAFT_58155 [Trichoplax adhaerens]|uniref:NADH dehydrogenase [ubiquinone] 1 alpha subcomplex subunit 11 n=1 Tax=Trichoplax adhaerens TaxID=10228 RepID=B3S111_TRIAD|nr:hypothetical protein TRIADDRAFT_58155 [Trichoplax adhaerens]EDV23486.1 hypothetical protein TRIADDRAFT_58155 [Trichoplax adhaerens]|eukprot:XP_002114396.1 hypothetical protein TRIADDRAFT_58155 [Trichoplax adhaerens]